MSSVHTFVLAVCTAAGPGDSDQDTASPANTLKGVCRGKLLSLVIKENTVNGEGREGGRCRGLSKGVPRGTGRGGLPRGVASAERGLTPPLRLSTDQSQADAEA